MTHKQNDNCVVLARVSSRAQEEEGYSLDAQERLAAEYIPKNSLRCLKQYRIAETASKSKERQIFNEMMKYIQKNRVKHLVVEKVDRLTRSFKDMVMIDEWLEDDGDRCVHLIKDGLVMNKYSRSQDKLNWGVKVLFAKNYTDNLREEVLKGRKEKLAAGWLPGKPPYGYKTVGEKGRKIHIPDDSKIRLVQQLFKEYLDPNQSLSSLTLYAEKIGMRTDKGRPFSRSAITENILMNPFYIGINRWQGIDYPGAQQKCIDEELFKAVQIKMKRKTGSKYQRHNPVYRNMIQCFDCGGTITWEFQKSVWYGHCNRYRGCPKKPYVKQDEIDEQIYEHFDKLLCPSSEIVEWIIGALKVKHQNDMYDYSASIDLLRQEKDRKKRQLDILYEDRLSERISPLKYDEISKKLIEEQKTLDEDILNMASKSREQLLTGIRILEKSQQASKVYSSKSPEDKRRLLNELFTDIHLDGKELHVKQNRYTQAISKRVQKHRKLEVDFRTKKITPINGGDPSLHEALLSVWRA